MDQKNGKFYHYLPNTNIMSICVDAANNVWAGADNRLYRYDREHDQFSPFTDPTTKSDIQGILHLLEDNNQNRWISTTSAIIKINDKRNEVKRYAESYGVHKNSFSVADNFKVQMAGFSWAMKMVITPFFLDK
jgi:ligand-binding sensor domain-containing protein